MRPSYRPFRNGPAWRVNLHVEPPAPELPAEPPLLQVVALLTAHASKFGSETVCGAVLTHLNANGTPAPTSYDFTQLREARYLAWNAQARVHVITPPGLFVAQRIAGELARSRAIHHVTIRPAGKRTNMGPTAICSCGHFHVHTNRLNGHTLGRKAAVHLDAVARGNWKPPRPIEEFLDEVMPLQLPFERRA